MKKSNGSKKGKDITEKNLDNDADEDIDIGSED
jgi:hypothetical protein